MKILAIETSCDDTCVALIEVVGKKQAKLNILSNVVSSQNEIHQKYGGVYPTLAKREHQRNLPLVLKKALKKTSQSKIDASANSASTLSNNQRIDLIAVTVGPGLEPCLWVGINFAKELARDWNLPIIPVNHIEGHIFANWLMPISSNAKRKTQNAKKQKIEFPAMCLIVSGGHTQLILMKDFGKYKILGETRDDAAGECFDKTARILELGYPGGPAIAAKAAEFPIPLPDFVCERSRRRAGNFQFPIKLPRPMIFQKNYDFSFSGLKTAVLYEIRKKGRKSKKFVQLMAAEIQQAIIDVLIHKTLKAAKDYQVKTIILGGGVAANQELRKQFLQRIKKEKLSLKFQVPDFKLCTDNAAMIGITGYFLWLKNKSKNLENIKADANLRM